MSSLIDTSYFRSVHIFDSIIRAGVSVETYICKCNCNRKCNRSFKS